MFTFEQIEKITGGHWIVPPTAERAVNAVVDDSRAVTADSLFVAIRGTLTDGHKYVRSAVEKGAVAVCLEQAPDTATAAFFRRRGTACLAVADSLSAFHALARAHRRKFARLPVVAITGSSGKTSTKEMLAAIFEQQWPGRVLKTAGNTNNHFGLPRNLFRLDADCRAAVLELGTSSPGEIAELTRMAEPAVGVVCSIGRAHIEALGDLEGVAREKGSLLAGLPDDGTAVFSLETPHADILATCVGSRKKLTFGTSDGAADIRVAYKGWTDPGYVMTLHWAGGHSETVQWQIGGRHQAMNAACAAAAATALGIKPATVAEGLRHCRLPGMRMQRIRRNGVHWFNDAYNANPESMRAGISWFHEATAAPPRIIVLGDMLELGSAAETEHLDLLQWAQEHFSNTEILTVGTLMRSAAVKCGLRNFATAAEVRSHIFANLKPGVQVFLKGSRSMGLENIVPES